MTQFAQLTLEGFGAPSAKIVALARVEQHADPDWLTSARAEVDFLARARDAFTTDDVWERLENHDTPPPREPRAMGAVMRAAAADKVIEASGVFQQSSREINHNRPVMIWRSLVR